MSPARTTDSPRLVDLAQRLLAQISFLTSPGGAAVTDTDAAARCEACCRELDQAGRAAGYATTDVRLAIFALVVMADERLLGSTWPGRTAWLKHPLQLGLFDINAGGEEFFLRLEHIRRGGGAGNEAQTADLLEIFLLCLRLGFCGRYGGSEGGRREVQELAAELETDLHRRRGAPALAILAAAPVTVPADRVPGLPAWLMPLAVAVAVLAVWAGLHLALAAETAALAELTREILP